MPSALVTTSMRDHSGQVGSASLRVPDLNALDALALLAIRSGWSVVVQALSTGNHESDTLSDTNVSPTQGDNASNVDSIRKNRMIFKYRDSTDASVKGSVSIPASDNQWEIPGTNDVDQTAVPVAAAIAFINTTCISILGNSVTVYDVVMG